MESNKNRKVSKIILVIVSVILLLIVGALIFILFLLPGPREIKEKLLEKEEVKVSTQIPKEIKLNQSEENLDKRSENLEKTQKDDAPIESNNKREKMDLIKRIIDEENVLSVCENMREDSSYKVGKGKEQVDIDTLFNESNKNDPILGTIRYTLVHVFKDKSLSSLLNDIIDSKIIEAGESERSSIFEKMNFYAKAAKTVIKLRSRKEEFEILADRAEHLRLLAMIAQLKPNQAYDSSFLETCDSLQTSILNSEDIDIRKEREMVLKIIEKSGLTPKQLSFNPKNYTKYEVKFSEDGLVFKLDSDDYKPD